MSRSLKFTAFVERPAPTQAVDPGSSASPGVDLCLKGWRKGLNKVVLTKTFRAGGVGLQDATRLTGRVLEGEEVCVGLRQFPDIESARSELKRIGVRDVRLP